MPLLSTPVAVIELPVSNRVVENTIIRQKARYESLEISQTESGECTVKLWVAVTPYALAEDGDYGQRMPPDFITRRIALLADNNTAVDPAANGALLYIRLTASTALNFAAGTIEEIPNADLPSAWRDYLNSKPESMRLQGDFFCTLRDTQPVLIKGLLEDHIRQADAMGRFS
ncbi:hypothetical protein [uncultured Hymenobacter sp.]|uniref:hypothetical protein n=1 Tax=uncultured Hymenobacter sp. TaxID=170016 RepID=UPI0035CB3124